MSELNLDAPEIKKLVKDAVIAADQKAEERTKDLVQKNTSLLNETKSLKIKLKDYNPEAIAELEKKVKEIDDAKHKQNIEGNDMEAVVKKYEDRLTEMMKVHEEKELKLTSELKALNTSYIGKTSKETVLEALAKRQVAPEVMLNNILPLVETQVDGENWNTIIKNPDGTPRVDPATQAPFTIENLLDEMSLNPAFAPNFPQAGGGGSNDNNGSSNISGVSKYSDLKTFDEKKAFLDKNGQDAVDKLIAAGQ